MNCEHSVRKLIIFWKTSVGRRKEEVKKIMGTLPDVADALALLFLQKKEIVIKTATATDVDAMMNRLSNILYGNINLIYIYDEHILIDS